MKLSLVGHGVVYLCVRIAVCVLQTLDMETCRWMARRFGFLASDMLHIREKVVEENLRKAFPQWTADHRRRVTRQMWEHLFLMIWEITQVPRKIHETNWRQHVRFHGDSRREFVRLLLDRRPLTMVSGHFGNFEVGSYMLGMFGMPSFAIARPLDNHFIDRYLKRFRRATGQQILPTQGSARQISAVLGAGHTLAMLGDQHAGRKGCYVEFFGCPASCHKAIALFPLTSGGPLAVSYAKRCGRPLQFEVGVFAVADPHQGGDHLAGVRELTQWYNWQLEQIVRQEPQQYWWLHRRWKGRPRRSRRRGGKTFVPAQRNSSRAA